MRNSANDENSIQIPSKLPRPFTPLQSRPPLRFLSFNQKPGCSELVFSHESDPKPLITLVPEIFSHLLQEECQHIVSDYMPCQSEINYKMRAILIDWLVSVHQKFRLQNETLFICVSLIDRYLAVRDIEKKYLQLVGICALMVASKYEEIYPPHSKDFVYVTDKAYTAEQLVKMEIDMLNAVQFTINIPTGLIFVERWAVILKVSEKCKNLAKYLCELALVEYHMSKFKGSLQALSAIYLSGKITKENLADVKKVAVVIKTNENEVKLCARELLGLFYSAQRHVLTCVRDKYSTEKCSEVSKIRI